MRTLFAPWVIALLCMLHLPGLVASQELAPANPNRVKAAFLRNFAHYVRWPAEAFPHSSTPWHICVLGPDPFGDILETSLQGRKEQGRSFEVFRAEALDQLPSCQIVFLAYKDDARRRAVLDKLKNKPVLTVGDAPEFLREGGTIRFQVDDRVRLGINLDQARVAELVIQTRMLEVSSEVLDNGVVRKMR
ncbi:YfiR family protein [Hydrogenophaga sp.]|uniref:YfiR family protein n=1 Tax=Hydrogenophaga sp. TaxID=1904254 RepID=UPI002FC96BF6